VRGAELPLLQPDQPVGNTIVIRSEFRVLARRDGSSVRYGAGRSRIGPGSAAYPYTPSERRKADKHNHGTGEP
jgi:hypothetical protein